MLKLPLVLDGATGTNLYKKGLPFGTCVEQWILNNEQAMESLLNEYIIAGSDIVYAPTFGGNSERLKSFGIENDLEINRDLVDLTKRAVGGRALIAGDLSPTGLMLEPIGTSKFDDVVDIYKRQIKQLITDGVDVIVAETFMSLNELRAAVIACKEVCDIPIFTTITTDENGKTIYGNSAISSLITLTSLGVAGFGLNCSIGPDAMLNTFKNIIPYAKVPLIAKPNAGVPSADGGEILLSPDYFYEFTKKTLKIGVSIIGGCCGTTPEHIAKIKQATIDTPLKVNNHTDKVYVANNKDIFEVEENINFLNININNDLIDNILDNNDYPLSFTLYNKEDVKKLLEAVSYINNIFLIICNNKDTLEAFIRPYEGVALVNTSDKACGELCNKYGSILI